MGIWISSIFFPIIIIFFNILSRLGPRADRNPHAVTEVPFTHALLPWPEHLWSLPRRAVTYVPCNLSGYLLEAHIAEIILYQIHLPFLSLIYLFIFLESKPLLICGT